MMHSRMHAGALPALTGLGWWTVLCLCGLAVLVSFQLAGEWIVRRELAGPDRLVPRETTYALHRMEEEVREAIAVIYPVPPTPGPLDLESPAVASTGFGIVNARGEPVFYYVEDPEIDPLTGQERARSLVRTNIADRSSQRLVVGVDIFRVVAGPARVSKPVTRLNVELSVLLRRSKDPRQQVRLNRITSLALLSTSRGGEY